MSTATFEPVSRRTISSEIRDRLLEAIRTGELIPGDPLPSERVLCQEFGVARTSVREAIQGLVTAGYLERRGNRPVVAEMLPTLDLTLRRPQDPRPPTVRGSPGDRAGDGPPRLRAGERARIGRNSSDLARGCPAHARRVPGHRPHLPLDDRATRAATRCSPRSMPRPSPRCSAATSSPRCSTPRSTGGRSSRSSAVPPTLTGRSPRRSPAATAARTVAAVTDHLTDVERRMLERLV